LQNCSKIGISNRTSLMHTPCPKESFVHFFTKIKIWCFPCLASAEGRPLFAAAADDIVFPPPPPEVVCGQVGKSPGGRKERRLLVAAAAAAAAAADEDEEAAEDGPGDDPGRGFLPDAGRGWEMDLPSSEMSKCDLF
jgi:hypothetical protein